MKTSQSWTDVGAISDIPLRGARVVRAGTIAIAVFRTGDGSVFAIEDKCPHRGGPLSQGIVHGRYVTCPLHNMVIDLECGGVVGPDEGCAKTIPVRLEGERVLLDLLSLVCKAA